MKVFVAGASGAIGRSLVPRLVAAGHDVTGTMRSEQRAEMIRAAGARAAICDALDADALHRAVGGFLWAAAAVAFQRRTAEASSRAARRDAGWARWGRRATLAAVLLPVPYAAVRWAWAFGLPLGVSTGADTIRHANAEVRVGMFVFGLLPLLGRLPTHGLTRRGGEVYPRWIPRRAGRPIHPAVAIVPASIAAVMTVTAGLFVYRAELNMSLGRVPESHPDVTGWGAWAPGLFWLPWGIALTVATYAYWRRRRAGAPLSENSPTAPVASRR
jgi:hypothetical protein